MTRLKFHELVERLAQRYEGRPGALALATAAWLVCGYAVLFSGLAAALCGGLALIVVGLWLAHQSAVWLVAGGTVVILLGLGLYGPLIWSPRRSRKELPLSAEDAPALHTVVEDIRRAVGCRRFHRILLCAEANAAVVTEPRFGLLGGSRSELLLGLPLMEVLSVDEFRSVLAHEFVHHSRAHGRFSVWVYRVRNSWERVYAELESGSLHRPLGWVRWFLRWYWPRMHARAFLLCREHEYQADRFAGEHVSPAVAATSLFRIETIDRYLDLTFWPVLQRESEKNAAPPRDLMSRLLTWMAAPPAAEHGAWCSAATYARLTDGSNTHPAWADRTAALGEDPARFERYGFPRHPSPSAARALLEHDWSRLSQRVSEIWAETVAEAWAAQHRRLSGLRRRLQQIAPLVESRPRDVTLRWEQACLVKELDGPEAVSPLLEALCNQDPPHRGATFELGQITLSHGNPRGAELLGEIVHRQRDAYYESACLALCSFFCLSGRFDDMREMEARLDGRDAWADWIREGHRHLARGVPVLPHGLAPDELEPLIEALARHAELAAAWLARVGSRYPGSPPLFVLCVRTVRRLFGLLGSAAEQRFARQLVGQIEVPWRLLIVARHGADRRLARRVCAVPESQIHPRHSDRPDE
ncbi:MAG: M48 family metallopeptidase [Planctomycetia bacterium]|nr:M48 family metallopeptidase [Planctomycetia bacterium]